MLYSLNAII